MNDCEICMSDSSDTVLDGIVDLRSDTLTVPTSAMRQAMFEAVVGDDVYGEDPTVRRLEVLAAHAVGKEAAVYVPSGTMGNQIALRVHTRPGVEVLCGERMHVRQYERAAGAQNAGVQFRSVPDENGVYDPAFIFEASEAVDYHLPPLGLVWIENTHMASGGTPLSPETVAVIAEACRVCGVPLHCDGARIFNAAVALGCSPTELSAGCDTIMFCLSKGLCAPVGSILAGSAALMEVARDARSRLGGGMRQAGVIAAPGILALQTMVDRLSEDHARARHFAEVLADVYPGSVDPEKVCTNIVCARKDRLSLHFLSRFASRGVRAGMIDARTVRFVFHKDVNEAGLARAVREVQALAAEENCNF